MCCSVIDETGSEGFYDEVCKIASESGPAAAVPSQSGIPEASDTVVAGVARDENVTAT
jgi:hypothetical protein